MRITEAIHSFLSEAGNTVPLWARWFVGVVAVGLVIATFGYLPLHAAGFEVSGWSLFVDNACHPLCHQIVGRSFQVSGYVFPLCARCTGMWIGITLGCAMAMVYRPANRNWVGAVVAVIGFAASALDWVREGSGGTPSEWARAVFGFVLFWGVTHAVAFDSLAVLSFAAWYFGSRQGSDR